MMADENIDKNFYTKCYTFLVDSIKQFQLFKRSSDKREQVLVFGDSVDLHSLGLVIFAVNLLLFNNIQLEEFSNRLCIRYGGDILLNAKDALAVFQHTFNPAQNAIPAAGGRSIATKHRYVLESVNGRSHPHSYEASGKTPIKAATKIASAIFRKRELSGSAPSMKIVVRRMQREGAQADKPRYAYTARWAKNPEGPKQMDFKGVVKTVGEYKAVLKKEA